MQEKAWKFEWKTGSQQNFQQLHLTKYAMVKIARLRDAFSEKFQLEESPVEA